MKLCMFSSKFVFLCLVRTLILKAKYRFLSSKYPIIKFGKNFILVGMLTHVMMRFFFDEDVDSNLLQKSHFIDFFGLAVVG